MIIYGLCICFYFILTILLNLIPVFSLPASLISAVTSAIQVCLNFNYYLPISDVFICFGAIITFSIQWKIICVILGKFGIDLNS